MEGVPSLASPFALEGVVATAPPVASAVPATLLTGDEAPPASAFPFTSPSAAAAATLLPIGAGAAVTGLLPSLAASGAGLAPLASSFVFFSSRSDVSPASDIFSRGELVSIFGG